MRRHGDVAAWNLLHATAPSEMMARRSLTSLPVRPEFHPMKILALAAVLSFTARFRRLLPKSLKEVDLAVQRQGPDRLEGERTRGELEGGRRRHHQHRSGEPSVLHGQGVRQLPLQDRSEVAARRPTRACTSVPRWQDKGFPKIYEAQLNNTYAKDPKRTGSLYNFVDVKEQLIEDDKWWVQEVIADGNHIIIKVDGKKVVDFIDEKRTSMKGHFAFQQHDPGSSVNIRSVMVKPLP